MMKEFYFLLVCLFLFCASITGQEPIINTDRPDQSDGVNTVPKSWVQIENGLTFGKKTFINNFMLRYGIAQSTEVRLLLDAGRELGVQGLKPLGLSVKQRLVQQKKLLPAITLVGYLFYEKLAGKRFQGNGLPYEIKLAFENECSDQFSLGYNIGSSNHFQTTSITLGLGYAPLDKLSTFAEYFSAFTSQRPEHNIDIGILFRVSTKLQLDMAGGHSIFDTDHRFFASAGVSYLF
ncbi:MAG TPA: transporter [Niabella sp.]|nr:transporter [Niabella sp.]HQW14994.1 transporter [Niabella sp.]HQX20114.1 transporter [Niabella sp.]HQX40374.1 transporter [Niabella sp.]HRB06719.1 transporter [Niabella sp.]